jgi:AcrR family transcriptional regulator
LSITLLDSVADLSRESPAMDEPTRNRILDTAVELAETSDWEAVRLHDVAWALGLTLDDIREEFREKDELIDAWFDRADSAMLREASSSDLERFSRRGRMHRVMMTWFGALAAHRRVTRQMILGKLEPGHIHIQFPGLMRVSRTVQWMREAAGYDAGFPRRAAEEIVHTSIYLATFTYWMSDDSAGSERTRKFLERQLNRVDFAFACRRDRASDEQGVRREGRRETAASADLAKDRPL